MYAFVVLRYLVPMERIEQTVQAHRAYLGELKARRKLVASGPFQPRTGGGLLLRVEDETELIELLDQDPFHKEGLVERVIHRWSPVIGQDDLDAI